MMPAEEPTDRLRQSVGSFHVNTAALRRTDANFDERPMWFHTMMDRRRKRLRYSDINVYAGMLESSSLLCPSPHEDRPSTAPLTAKVRQLLKVFGFYPYYNAAFGVHICLYAGVVVSLALWLRSTQGNTEFGTDIAIIFPLLVFMWIVEVWAASRCFNQERLGDGLRWAIFLDSWEELYGCLANLPPEQHGKTTAVIREEFGGIFSKVVKSAVPVPLAAIIAFAIGGASLDSRDEMLSFFLPGLGLMVVIFVLLLRNGVVSQLNELNKLMIRARLERIVRICSDLLSAPAETLATPPCSPGGGILEGGVDAVDEAERGVRHQGRGTSSTSFRRRGSFGSVVPDPTCPRGAVAMVDEQPAEGLRHDFVHCHVPELMVELRKHIDMSAIQADESNATFDRVVGATLVGIFILQSYTMLSVLFIVKEVRAYHIITIATSTLVLLTLFLPSLETNVKMKQARRVVESLHRDLSFSLERDLAASLRFDGGGEAEKPGHEEDTTSEAEKLRLAATHEALFRLFHLNNTCVYFFTGDRSLKLLELDVKPKLLMSIISLYGSAMLFMLRFLLVDR